MQDGGIKWNTRLDVPAGDRTWSMPPLGAMATALLVILGATACGSEDGAEPPSRSTPSVPLGPTTSTYRGEPSSSADATVSGSEPASDQSSGVEDTQPLAQGLYAGTFTVVEDSSRAPQDGESSNLVGEVFEREFLLEEDCDSSDECTISHDSLALYYPDEEVQLTWNLERDPEQWIATYGEYYQNDCVDALDNVVGTFDTEASFELKLQNPKILDGRLAWTAIEVSFVENSVSTDTEVGCFTSRYASEGTLHRTGELPSN